jgi:hypothetical protein
VTDDLRARADDVVWRARWGESRDYLYVLIEFQSTVEPYMAVRILTYVGLMYQDLIKAAPLAVESGLPPVVPIVLYNGSARWQVPEDSSSLVQRGPPGCEAYLPRMRYLLIDESRYRDTELLPKRNLVAALFRLENSRTYAEIDAVIGVLIEWLSSAEHQSLRRAFAVWVSRVILARVSGVPTPRVYDLQEMRPMLAERIEEWAEEFKREGLLRGHQEGEACVVLRQLRKRFGELPTWVHTRVREAPSAQLECWAERLLDISSLDALFEDTESTAANGR